MAGFENDVMVAKNVNFDGAAAKPHLGIINAAGKFPIGTGNFSPTPEILGGSITSPLATLVIGYASPNITIDLVGGGKAIDSVAVQTGTSPVLPNAAGLLTFNGALVSAGTNPVRTDGTGANTMALEVQTSQALAAADSTKVGLSNFDSSSFAVAATGFVTLATTGALKTLTGDTGTATPVANNIQIAGGPGITTSASGAIVTINSVVYTDQPATTTVTSDSGSFVTAGGNIILNLPASPAQGELIEVVCTTANLVALDAPATHFIRIGTLITSIGGTATSTQIGDSIKLRFRLADLTWYSVGGVSGTWVMA